jgi:hypothetical protein
MPEIRFLAVTKEATLNAQQNQSDGDCLLPLSGHFAL